MSPCAVSSGNSSDHHDKPSPYVSFLLSSLLVPPASFQLLHVSHPSNVSFSSIPISKHTLLLVFFYIHDILCIFPHIHISHALIFFSIFFVMTTSHSHTELSGKSVTSLSFFLCLCSLVCLAKYVIIYTCICMYVCILYSG